MRLDRSLLLPLLPWCVGAASLAITGVLWQHERVTTERTLKADFDFSVRQMASRIEARLASCEQMLRGVQGLFQSGGTVGRPQFEAYVDALLAGPDFAGVQYVAYAAKAPAGPVPTDTAAIALVAPATGINLKVLGDDPWADPAVRAAMQQSGDSGGLGVTPRLPDVVARERGSQPGFLMFLPIYAGGTAPGSVAERRAALAGWVVAGMRMHDLMSSLYGEGTPGLDLRVHDGLEVNEQSLMYGATPAATARQPQRFGALEYIGVAGHTWTLALGSRPEFEQRTGGDAATIIAASGAGFSLLLGLLTHQLVGGRQRARAAALAMTSELRASEARYRRIVETTDEGIWVTDDRQRTSFVNPKLAQMLGHSPEALLGRRPAEFRDDSGPAPTDPREARYRRKDGTTLWVSMTRTPVLDADGQPAGELAMVTDISQHKQADAARAELELQLRESQKMEAIGTLAGGIAHDFNNILAAILGNVGLAQAHAAQDPALQGNLEQIGKAAARARSLVQQILAFSRREPHRLQRQALRPLVEESERLLRPVLPALAEISLQLTDAPVHVLADPTQLQQVVMNLCTNAWHALGGRPGRITIGLDTTEVDTEAARRLGLPAGSYAHLWVADTGAGMDEATRSRVFEPFFTTKPVGQGTGLGLSVVHGIVATHGGAITVHSTPGAGSCFDLYVPLLEAPDDDPALALASGPEAGAADRHVAYVDDDPVMVVMVQALLEHAGFRVTAYEDPREAVAALRAGTLAPDVVVTDYNMPGMSGLDVADEVRRLRPGLPVIVSSGYVTEDLVAAAARLGVEQVMQKEYTAERLPGLLSALFGPSRRAAPPPAA